MADYNLGTARGVIEIDYRGNGPDDAARDLNRVGDSAEASADRTKRASAKMQAAGAIIAAGFAIAVKSAWDAAKAAGDIEQSIGAVETIWGDKAAAIVKKSDDLAWSLGITQQQFLDMATALGQAGLTSEQALDKIVGSGADLVAAFGDSTHGMNEFSDALSGAFRGEYDPLQRYVPSLTAASVESEAARVATKKFGAELGSLPQKQQDAAKKQALLNLVNKDAKKVSGQAAREADTFVGALDRLKAGAENAQVAVGAVLGPAIADVVNWIIDVAAPAIKDFADRMADRLAPVVEQIKDFFADLLDKLEPVGEWLASHPEIIEGAATALGLLAGALTAVGIALGIVAVVTSPITLVVAAVAALGGLFAYAWKNSEKFRDGIKAIGDALGDFITAVRPVVDQIVEAVAGKFRELEPQLRETWNSIKDIVRTALDIVKIVIQRATDIVKGIWRRFGGTIVRFITTTMENVAGVVRNAFKIIQGLFQIVKAVLTGDWRGLWTGIKNVVSGALGVVKAVLSQAWNVIRTAASIAWNALKEVVSRALDGVVNVVTGLKDRVLGALGDVGSWLYEKGKQIIQGLIDGIASMAGALADKAKSVIGDGIGKLIPGSPVKEGPLRVLNDGYAGRKMIEMVAEGIVAMKPMLEQTVATVVSVPQLTGDLGRVRGSSHVGFEALDGGSRGLGARSRGSAHPTGVRVLSGTLDISPRGKAFIRGQAEDVYEGHSRFGAAYGRMG